MYIRIDENNNITDLIVIGGKPETGTVYELDHIDEEIMLDIHNYKYIDGQFIKSNTDIRLQHIDEIKQAKINNISLICKTVIEQGIEFGGSHYSLTTTDQINLMKLESVARFSPETTLLYHADGEECRVFSNEEIIAIATIGIGWITFNTTYFNQLKAQILSMTNIDDIIAMNYGSPLNELHNTQFTLLTQGLDFTIPEVIDTYDYNVSNPQISSDVIKDALMIQEQNKQVEVEPEIPDDPPLDEDGTNEASDSTEITEPNIDVDYNTDEEIVEEIPYESLHPPVDDIPLQSNDAEVDVNNPDTIIPTEDEEIPYDPTIENPVIDNTESQPDAPNELYEQIMEEERNREQPIEIEDVEIPDNITDENQVESGELYE